MSDAAETLQPRDPGFSLGPLLEGEDPLLFGGVRTSMRSAADRYLRRPSARARYPLCHRPRRGSPSTGWLERYGPVVLPGPAGYRAGRLRGYGQPLVAACPVPSFANATYRHLRARPTVHDQPVPGRPLWGRQSVVRIPDLSAYGLTRTVGRCNKQAAGGRRVRGPGLTGCGQHHPDGRAARGSRSPRPVGPAVQVLDRGDVDELST